VGLASALRMPSEQHAAAVAFQSNLLHGAGLT
jgi:hypothetical protein